MNRHVFSGRCRLVRFGFSADGITLGSFSEDDDLSPILHDDPSAPSFFGASSGTSSRFAETCLSFTLLAAKCDAAATSLDTTSWRIPFVSIRQM
jgi:hypothetical protein